MASVNHVLGSIILPPFTIVNAGMVAGADIDMEYVQYERLLTEAHGIDLVGWPDGILFANPSKVSHGRPASVTCSMEPGDLSLGLTHPQ